MANETIDINGSPTQARVIPAPTNGVPSIIKIPNQLAVTICWVALGAAIGYYICHKTTSPSPRRSQGFN